MRAHTHTLPHMAGDGVSGPNERATLATTSGLTHGLAFFGNYLFASTATTVYRWPYTGVCYRT